MAIPGEEIRNAFVLAGKQITNILAHGTEAQEEYVLQLFSKAYACVIELFKLERAARGAWVQIRSPVSAFLGSLTDNARPLHAKWLMITEEGAVKPARVNVSLLFTLPPQGTMVPSVFMNLTVVEASSSIIMLMTLAEPSRRREHSRLPGDAPAMMLRPSTNALHRILCMVF